MNHIICIDSPDVDDAFLLVSLPLDNKDENTLTKVREINNELVKLSKKVKEIADG
ncbi:hypothetical protein [Candidatus Sororendozoicomonas aggregata]|uniref:hypothetical protein n=1 Tax=Candidatus Sororendozoicomonas aggregata TaxID=3073239 RepID=UPI002ED0516A